MNATPAESLLVETFLCSREYQENCFLLYPESAGVAPAERPCWIVDPGFGASAVVAAIARNRLRPEAILLTHGHLDHIAGVPELRSAWPKLPIWIGRREADALESPQVNLSAYLGMPMSLDARPDRLLDGGETLTLGGLEFRAICVPGHSPASLCFHCPASGDLFVGDVILMHSIGRTDFPGGDMELLLEGIRQRLLTLPRATRLWSGHGPVSTIAQELVCNEAFGSTES